MKNETEVNRLLQNLKQAATHEDAQKFQVHIEERLRQLDNSTGQFYFLFDFSTLEYRYFSENAFEVFGFDLEIANELGSMGFLQHFLHPEDVESVFSLLSQFMAFIGSVDVSQRQNLRGIFSYRFRKRNGEYVRVVDQTSVVSSTPSGAAMLNFGAVSIVPIFPNEMRTSGAVVDVTTGEQLILFDSTSTLIVDELTPRERQIVGLIATRYSSKEISEKLQISLSTVETHRKNIVRKLNIINPVDLVWKAIEYNLIQN